MQAFGSAKAKWESVIASSDGMPFTFDQQGISNTVIATTRPTFPISDLYMAGVESVMDGPGRVLGTAGPQYGRYIDGILKPIVGAMNFDTADIARLEAQGRWEDIIMHEMGHVLGIGSLWGINNLLQSHDKGMDYVGQNALRQWQDEIGCSGSLPIETQGGPGTAGSHWMESCLDGELTVSYTHLTLPTKA